MPKGVKLMRLWWFIACFLGTAAYAQDANNRCTAPASDVARVWCADPQFAALAKQIYTTPFVRLYLNQPSTVPHYSLDETLASCAHASDIKTCLTQQYTNTIAEFTLYSQKIAPQRADDARAASKLLHEIEGQYSVAHPIDFSSNGSKNIESTANNLIIIGADNNRAYITMDAVFDYGSTCNINGLYEYANGRLHYQDMDEQQRGAFTNESSCAVDSKTQNLVNANPNHVALIEPTASDAIEGACRANLFLKAGAIHFDDPDNNCARTMCGSRGHINGVKFELRRKRFLSAQEKINLLKFEDYSEGSMMLPQDYLGDVNKYQKIMQENASF